jgi:hypothetical protein
MTFPQRRTHSQWDRLGYDTLVWQISTGVKGKTPPQYSGQSWSALARKLRSLVRRYLQGMFRRNVLPPPSRQELHPKHCPDAHAINQKTTVWIIIAVKIWKLMQGCTNPGHHVIVASKLWTVAHNICGSSTWNMPLVSLLVPRTLRWFPRLWKICAPLIWLQISSYQQCYTADKQGNKLCVCVCVAPQTMLYAPFATELYSTELIRSWRRYESADRTLYRLNTQTTVRKGLFPKALW